MQRYDAELAAGRVVEALEWLRSAMTRQAELRRQIARDAARVEAFLRLLEGQALLLLGHEEESIGVLTALASLMEGDDSDRALWITAATHQSTADALLRLRRVGPAQEEATRAFEGFAGLGDWSHAVTARIAVARCAQMLDNRKGFLDELDQVLSLARRHSLAESERQVLMLLRHALIGWDVAGELRETLRRSARQLAAADPSLLAELNTTEAWRRAQSGIPQQLPTAEALLRDSLRLELGDEQKATVRAALAEVLALAGQHAAAVAEAEAAFAVARRTAMPEVIWAALHVLTLVLITSQQPAARRRALEELEAFGGWLEERGRTEIAASVLILRGELLRRQDSVADALTAVDDAIGRAAGHWRTLETALALKVLLLSDRGNRELLSDDYGGANRSFEEALHASERLSTLLARVDVVPGDASEDTAPWVRLEAWRDRLQRIEFACTNAAHLSHRLGRDQQAFAWVERGRSLLLRHALAGSSASKELPRSSLKRLFAQLHRDGAAMVTFCVDERGTLVLVVDPTERQIVADVVNIGNGRLRELGLLGHDVHSHREAAFAAIPALSNSLLSEHVKRAARTHRLLYVVPDGPLYAVPFPALTDEAGSPVIEQCAIAYVPGAAFVAQTLQPAVEPARRTCLVLAHADEDAIPFSRHAMEIALLGWLDGRVIAPATRDDLLGEDLRVNALHVACHGQLDLLADPLAASSLSFGGEELVTARDVVRSGRRFNCDLVFMNACLSGRFDLRLKSEVEGFWRSFLQAGAAALIVTLLEVEPEDAQRLAVAFYEAWLAGTPRAEALRRAQLRRRQQTPDPRRWAGHVLVGAPH